jgi:predicted component of type VI protein secretion system
VTLARDAEQHDAHRDAREGEIKRLASVDDAPHLAVKPRLKQARRLKQTRLPPHTPSALAHPHHPAAVQVPQPHPAVIVGAATPQIAPHAFGL